MWKSLNPSEKVHTGNTIRYRSSSSYLKSTLDKIYDVVKSDQHYFEVEARANEADTGERDRKVIKYMDVGYHISLEIWSGKGPFIGRNEDEIDETVTA